MKFGKSLYLSLAAFILIIDRITKLAALQWCAQSAYVVSSYLSFDVVFNRGISWGMLHSASNSMFIFVSLVQVAITALLCWSLYILIKNSFYNYVRGSAIIGLICIIAGSLSNLIDRAVYGGVIDFILLSYNNYSWPVFNVADAAIVCGVGILIFFDEK